MCNNRIFLRYVNDYSHNIMHQSKITLFLKRRNDLEIARPMKSAVPKIKMEVGGNCFENDLSGIVNLNSSICSDSNSNIKQETIMLTDIHKPSSGLAIKFKDCEICCLQDIEELNKICQQMNLKFMKPQHTRPKRNKLNSESEEEYEVEEIVDYVRDKCQDWYFIKWKGWESEFNTWEPYSNLTGCQELIDDFHLERRKNNHINSSCKRKLNPDDEARKEKLQTVYKLFTEICKPSTKDLATLFKLKGITLTDFEKSGSNVKKLKRDLKSMFSDILYKGNEKALNKLEERCDSNLIEFARKRREVLELLKKWETEINRKSETCRILVENNVDLEGPPQNFTYITDYKAGEGIEIPDDPLIGCECRNCYENQKNCCSMQSGGNFAYNRYGYLKVPKGTPIYECNKRCKCRDDCLNRVVQKGRQIKLAIFRTHDGRGWGVKSLEKIKKGTFIMEYVGEVITSEEAEKRGQIYDSEGRTYLFDLDYNDGDCPFTVDAAYYGNVSHFMNHSCDPNLVVYGVWINNLDPRLPHIAFFSQRDIKRGEELTFDYLMTNSTSAITSSPSKMSMPASLADKGIEKADSQSSHDNSDDMDGTSLSGSSDETVITSFTTDVSNSSLLTSKASSVSTSDDQSSLTSNLSSLHSPNKAQTRKRIVCKCGAKNCRGFLF